MGIARKKTPNAICLKGDSTTQLEVSTKRGDREKAKEIERNRQKEQERKHKVPSA